MNFQNYGVNIATNDFKKTLLKGLGDSVNCVTSYSNQGKQSIQTFSVKCDNDLAGDHEHLRDQP